MEMKERTKITDTEIKVDYIIVRTGCVPPTNGTSSKNLADYFGEFFLLGVTVLTLLGWNQMASRS